MRKHVLSLDERFRRYGFRRLDLIGLGVPRYKEYSVKRVERCRDV